MDVNESSIWRAGSNCGIASLPRFWMIRIPPQFHLDERDR